MAERDLKFMDLALQQAKLGREEGGVPVGACLVSSSGDLLALGRNRRVQKGSCIKHGETDCIENAGRLPPSVYKTATMYTTLSPCDMCTGAILLYGIPRVIIGENKSFLGGDEYLKSRGVELVVLDSQDCKTLMQDFISQFPQLWNEDISVTSTTDAIVQAET